MRIPDPLAPFAGGPLHRIDIAFAEWFTGVPRRSVSRHVVQPMVRAGARPSDAVAALHWVLLGLGAWGLARAWRNRARRR